MPTGRSAIGMNRYTKICANLTAEKSAGLNTWPIRRSAVLITGENNLCAGSRQKFRESLSHVIRVAGLGIALIGGRTRRVADLVQAHPVVLVDLADVACVSDVVSRVDQDRMTAERPTVCWGNGLRLGP